MKNAEFIYDETAFRFIMYSSGRRQKWPLETAISAVNTKNGDAVPKSYFGGKAGAGVYQRLINLIPPHSVFISAFLGRCAIMRYKRPALRNIGIELDSEVLESWYTEFLGRHILPEVTAKNGGSSEFEFHNTNALAFLRSYAFTGSEFVYADPPYLKETRRSSKDQYRFEMTDKQHIELLTLLKSLPCKVMISGYHSELYAKELSGWNSTHFTAQTRQGPAEEWVWMNYPLPTELHDYRYIGSDFRERENIKKRLGSLERKIRNLNEIERKALFAALGK